MTCLAPLGGVLLLLTLLYGQGDALTRHILLLREKSPNLSLVMGGLTDATADVLYGMYIVLFIWGLARGDQRLVRLTLSFALVQLCVTVLLVQGVKFAVGRPRPLPAFLDAGYAPFVFSSAYHSFPSGHTAEITGAASALSTWFCKPQITLLMGLLIALVGFSRIFLSMHHLSDVVAGALLGVLASLLIHYLSRGPS